MGQVKVQMVKLPNRRPERVMEALCYGGMVLPMTYRHGGLQVYLCC